MDIRFYDFEFNLLYILPQFSGDIGYVSVNTEQNLNDCGMFDIVFSDDSLKKVIEDNRDNVIVSWNGFQGVLTSFKWDSKCRICGLHLNGLLKRAVIPGTEGEVTDDAETLARSAVSENIPWLYLGEVKGLSEDVTYSTERYTAADAYIRELLKLDNAGYKITADFKNKKYIFEIIKPEQNPLMLSAANLNAHNMQVGYINTEAAIGGWYLKEQAEDAQGNKPDPVWTYITLDSTKQGIYKTDAVLSATTESGALNELKEKKADFEVTAETKDIHHGTDYNIGDIIRVQCGGVTSRKLVSGLSMWNENGYGEEPILTEWESEENG